MQLSDLVDNHGQIYGSNMRVAAVIAARVAVGPVVVSWCDGEGTRLTVLFAIPAKVGIVPGLNPDDTWLYVAVEGYGTYGFAVKDEPLAASYIAEKLGRKSVVNPTWTNLAELVGNVRIALARDNVTIGW